MKLCILIAISLLFAGCDTFYPPVVLNGYNVPIEISLTFSNSPTPGMDRLLPGEASFRRKRGAELEKLIV
jgi:hypothetical protein